MGDRASELVEPGIGRIGCAGLARQGRITGRRDGLALIRNILGLGDEVADDHRQKNTIPRNLPSCRRSAGRSGVDRLQSAKPWSKTQLCPPPVRGSVGLLCSKTELSGMKIDYGSAGEDARRPIGRRSWCSRTGVECDSARGFAHRFVVALAANREVWSFKFTGLRQNDPRGPVRVFVVRKQPG